MKPEDVFNSFQKKYEKLDKECKHSRRMSRDTIYKIVLISAGIVGFSVSIASLNFIKQNINFSQLYFSWKLFLGVIVIGFFILFIEPRIEHAKSWRVYLLSGNPDINDMKKLSAKQKLKVSWVIFKCLLLPENIYLDELTNNKKQIEENQLLSHVVLNNMARFGQKVIFWAENLFVVVFVISLIVFILAFGSL